MLDRLVGATDHRSLPGPGPVFLTSEVILVNDVKADGGMDI